MLRELNEEEGHTIVMVTHDAAAAAAADRVIFLRDGKLAGEVEGGSTRRAADYLASLQSDERARARGSPRRTRCCAPSTRSRSASSRTRPLRSAPDCFGVVLGVGMVFGVLLLTGTIRSTFDELIDSAWGKTDLIVMGEGNGTMPERHARRRASAIRGVDEAAGMVGGMFTRLNRGRQPGQGQHGTDADRRLRDEWATSPTTSASSRGAGWRRAAR